MYGFMMILLMFLALSLLMMQSVEFLFLMTSMRLFKLVSMSGALEELLVLNKKILDIQLHELVSRHGAVTIYYLYLCQF
ncbi:hypothetical protein IGI04_015677 [Brassica rapa subsp. trilocularis]|uniref:Secreted protein n=1 Tax=Brassica rapa subsp. trilocularis TaxID=1813537 RepID=A0ABQ7MQS3_BRACM|nr:hypothetical protein IGI04_015677 [Brassica rapa subsp. trilocularis]